MKDVQNEHDNRNITIDRVGVKNVSYPITVVQKNNTQQTIANISMSVKLADEFRGTHMSRFIDTLKEYNNKISPDNLKKITARLCEKLGASESSVVFEFPYHFKKLSPVSKIESYSRCDISMTGNFERGNFDYMLGINLNVQTLCPCSKEISDYGAHNQRALINLSVRFFNEPVEFEELINIIENASSSPLHTLLKREDEKFVTEHAYNKPRFVEDVLRELALSLNNDARISWYKIIVESYESIHNHNAFSEIERLKKI